MRQPGAAKHAQIYADEGKRLLMLGGGRERHRLRQMLACCDHLANKGEGHPKGKMARHLEHDIGLTLGLGE